MGQKEQWDERYAAGALPWDTGEPDPHLVAFVAAGLRGGRALEIGCGTGTNAVWLASRGFDVVAIDLAPRAVALARERAAAAGVKVDFRAGDFLADGVVPGDVVAGPFDFVFDRGCFHVFDAAEDRDRFAARVAALLAPGGRWLTLVGSTEGGPRDSGPPRRSFRDLADAIEPHLEILEIRRAGFDPAGSEPLAWVCVAGARAVPAVGSTRR